MKILVSLLFLFSTQAMASEVTLNITAKEGLTRIKNTLKNDELYKKSLNDDLWEHLTSDPCMSSYSERELQLFEYRIMDFSGDGEIGVSWHELRFAAVYTHNNGVTRAFGNFDVNITDNDYPPRSVEITRFKCVNID